jgi:hypothetical protein
MTIEACIYKEDERSKFVEILSNLSSKFEKLSIFSLRGMALGENIGDLVKALNRPNIKKLDLSMNGIEAEFCLMF